MRLNPAITINQFTGLNERADPVRVGAGKGKMPFIAASNLDIDDTGMVSLKTGYVLTLPGNFQSLWAKDDLCLFNDQGTLKALGGDLKSFNTVLTGLDPTAPISYVSVNKDVYLTNNAIIGYVRDGVFNNLADPAKTFKAVMPAGHLIEYFNSRLYVARDEVIIYSDPATCRYFDKRHNFIWMRGKVTLMKAVSDGIFVSDGSNTYFMGGMSPTESSLVKVADYPANEDSVIVMQAENIGIKDLPAGDVMIWSSPKGFCLGGSKGLFINLSKERVHLYQSTSNAALGRLLPGKSHYLFLSEIQKADVDFDGVPLEATVSMSADL